MFKGVIPALITPFKDDGSVDFEGLKRNVEFLVDRGVDAVVPCGSTGESATLSHEEHVKVIEATVEASDVPVIAGTGSNNTLEAIELTKMAEDVGADAAMVICPYYNKPTDDGLIQHFQAIANATNLPIVMYNVPGRTGRNIPPKVVSTLAKTDNIVGIKEASGDLMQIAEIIRLTKDEEFVLLSGDDGLTLPILSIGGMGVISVAANVAPTHMKEMVDSFFSGNIDKAKELHYTLMPLFKALFVETNPIPVKKACELIGLAGGKPRLPLVELSVKHEELLRSVLSDLGVL
jgi:4-hydroxy-tetrahydrodipicolinate synthase